MVNFIVYHVLVHSYGLENWFIFNGIAIIASIIFAYVVNRRFVFHSEQAWIPEIIKFFVSRGMISLIFEQGGMYLLLDICKFNPSSSIFGFELYWSKVLVQFFVVIGNYIVSKLFVFKR